MPTFDIIAFDADDTLWHHEGLYVDAQTHLTGLLANYHNPEWVAERLYQTEKRNIQQFGYGIKGFTLSMIETAIELTEGRITAAEIQSLIDFAKGMLTADVQLINGVRETLTQLASTYPLMVITKGDLLDQETKITRSGLAPYFRHIEVVSQKTPERYQRLLGKHAIDPARFLMVGNSLRSDVLPVLEIGAAAVHIPHEITWVGEVDHPPSPDHPGFHRLDHIGQLPSLLEQLERPVS